MSIKWIIWGMFMFLGIITYGCNKTTGLSEIHTGKEICQNICIEDNIQTPCDCQEETKTNWNNPLTYLQFLFFGIALVIATINLFGGFNG
jgi:hypothetical protein